MGITAEDIKRDGCVEGEVEGRERDRGGEKEDEDECVERDSGGEETVRDNRGKEECTSDFFAGRDQLITLKYMGCGTGLCALVGAALTAWGGCEVAELVNNACSVTSCFVRAYAGTCYVTAGLMLGGIVGAFGGFFGGYKVGCLVEEEEEQAER